MLPTAYPPYFSSPSAVARLGGSHDVEQQRILDRNRPRKAERLCGGTRHAGRFQCLLRAFAGRNNSRRIRFNIDKDPPADDWTPARGGEGGSVWTILLRGREPNSRQGYLPCGFPLYRNLDDIEVCEQRARLTLKRFPIGRWSALSRLFCPTTWQEGGRATFKGLLFDGIGQKRRIAACQRVNCTGSQSGNDRGHSG